MHRIPIAVVGLRFGRTIVEQLMTGPGREHCELVGVCDLDGDRVRAIAGQTGVRPFL